MLVLTRKTQQQIQIGPHITITILKVKGQTIRVGIDAPRDVTVLRSELADKLAVRADAATVQAAHAANQRERQRATGGSQASTAAVSDASASEGSTSQATASQGSATAADIVAPLTTLMRCRSSRVAGQRLGTRNRRRLLAVTSAVAVES